MADSPGRRRVAAHPGSGGARIFGEAQNAYGTLVSGRGSRIDKPNPECYSLCLLVAPCAHAAGCAAHAFEPDHPRRYSPVTAEQQIDHALAYFTDEEHFCSFELLSGKGGVMLSAPHAMLQTRNGSIKCAERFTGMLCRLMHERIGCPVIYKTRHLRDDANFDPVSDYRDALCRYVKAQGVRLVIDQVQP